MVTYPLAKGGFLDQSYMLIVRLVPETGHVHTNYLDVFEGVEDSALGPVVERPHQPRQLRLLRLQFNEKFTKVH